MKRYTPADLARFKRNFIRAHRRQSLRAAYWVECWAKALLQIGRAP